MTLGELIEKLKYLGNQCMSWYGIETNIDSVSDIKEVDGKFLVTLKTKD